MGIASISQPVIHVRPMHSRVTTGAETRSLPQVAAVVFKPDENFSPVRIRARHLRVALETEIGVALDEHLGVDGAVRIVADDAAFAQCRMIEHVKPRLLAMALRATFVEPRHRESAGGLHDVRAVRVVALDAIHLTFDDRMMMRQIEFGVRLQVALETGGSVLAGIENEFPAPTTSLNVKARCAVTRFATSLSLQLRVFKMQPRVRAGGESPRDVRVAVETNFVADERGSGNLRRRDDGAGDGGTRDENERARASDKYSRQPGK